VLAGPTDLSTARDRHAGFLDGLTQAGVPTKEVRVVRGAFSRDGGYASAHQLIDDRLGASCVFACSDVMAVGAIAAFRDNGIRVPEDVSVAGFDDIKPLRDIVPGLTTVHLDLEELGERAALLALDSSPENRPQLVRARGKVVLRDSTRRLS
jgi:LacI family transcriptional regulator